MAEGLLLRLGSRIFLLLSVRFWWLARFLNISFISKGVCDVDVGRNEVIDSQLIDSLLRSLVLLVIGRLLFACLLLLLLDVLF